MLHCRDNEAFAGATEFPCVELSGRNQPVDVHQLRSSSGQWADDEKEPVQEGDVDFLPQATPGWGRHESGGPQGEADLLWQSAHDELLDPQVTPGRA